ncbi:ROK family protein [Nitritalea halalkaliphila]|nr:ROK family protein [Nitritalea halalkaliphila]
MKRIALPILGIDIGGTSTKAALYQEGTLRQHRRIATPTSASGEDFYAFLCALIQEELEREMLGGIALASPGLIDVQGGRVLQVNNLAGLENFPLCARLEARFGLPVRLENDANAHAYAEHKNGAAQGSESSVTLSLGTGLGGGIVMQDQLVRGVFSAAGEWCSVPYLEGTFETYCSSVFFFREYQGSPEACFQAARAGESRALLHWETFGRHLGALAQVIASVLAPECIVFSGTISRAFPLFEGALRETFQQHPYPLLRTRTQIRQAALSESGVIGAASYLRMRKSTLSRLPHPTFFADFGYLIQNCIF